VPGVTAKPQTSTNVGTRSFDVSKKHDPEKPYLFIQWNTPNLMFEVTIKEGIEIDNVVMRFLGILFQQGWITKDPGQLKSKDEEL